MGSWTADAETDSEIARVKDSLQALLESIPFSTIGVEQKKNLPEHETWSADLRPEEQMILAMGGALPHMESIRKLGFPGYPRHETTPGAAPNDESAPLPRED
jgi:hypothetical protein